MDMNMQSVEAQMFFHAEGDKQTTFFGDVTSDPLPENAVAAFATDEWLDTLEDSNVHLDPVFLDAINNFDVDYLIPPILPSPSDNHQQHSQGFFHQDSSINGSAAELEGGEQSGPEVDYFCLPSCRYESLKASDSEQDDLAEGQRLLEEAESQEENSELAQSPIAQSTDTDSGFLSATDTNDSSEAQTDSSTCTEDESTEEQVEEKAEPSPTIQSPGGQVKGGKQPKPDDSYMALIAQAILGSSTGRLLLSDIYQHVLDTNPYYRTAKCAWRNSIRHNLSVNECFIKAGRARNGRGFYWAIHPACVSLFQQGDFNRRLARAAVQHSQRITSAAATSRAASPSINAVMSPTLQVLQPSMVSPATEGHLCFSPYTVGGQDHLQYQPMSSTPIRSHAYHPYSRSTSLPTGVSYSRVPRNQQVYYNFCAGAGTGSSVHFR